MDGTEISRYLLFIFLGFLASGYGTIIGIGGGLVLVPVLLFLYPSMTPEIVTTISLTMVFFNALSGSIAYSRMGRIDFRSGLLFSCAVIPGAILGSIVINYIPRRTFEAIFGVIMIIFSIILFFKPTKEGETKHNNKNHLFKFTLTESNGKTHFLSYNPFIGIVLSLFVGLFASLMGVGGGVIHVPSMVHFLNYPVHIATATSTFILMITALTSTITHIFTGAFFEEVKLTIPIVIGAVIGGQVGARISQRLKGSWIIRVLALSLAFAGIRLLIKVYCQRA